MSDINNVFISHYHENENGIEDLRQLLGDKYAFRNSSVTSDKFNRAKDPDYIKTLLRSRIDWAGKVICLIGPKTHESEWVNFEIEAAMKKGKDIIGIYLRGAMDSDIPDALYKYASAIVGWSKATIVRALNGEGTFQNADGSSWVSDTGNRGTC